jgi:hypothetical protein
MFSVTIFPFVDLQNIHGCIDIIFDMRLPLFENRAKGINKEFILI